MTYFSLHLPAAVVLLFIIGAGLGILLLHRVGQRLVLPVCWEFSGRHRRHRLGHNLQRESHFLRGGNGQNEYHAVPQHR